MPGLVFGIDRAEKLEQPIVGHIGGPGGHHDPQCAEQCREPPAIAAHVPTDGESLASLAAHS